MHGQWQVAIDFGTSNAIVVLGGPNGWTQPVPFDGGSLLHAGVFAAENGQLLTGRDAERGALRAPGRYEPYPKRRIDEGRVLLGDREFEVSWLIGAVLSRAYAEACRLARTRVGGVVLPCPVGWGQRRRAVLTAAAAAARLPQPRLVTEPVAAATHLVGARGVPVPPGRCVLVYDLGGGTFEATVLRRTPTGFDVVATEGLDDVGGNDIDAAIVTYLRQQVRPDDAAWRQLTMPESTTELQATRALWDGVRAAKERLSRASSTVVSVPLLGVDAPLGREQFEEMARPILERTVAVARSVLAAARLAPTELAAVFPVDGSSRIPLVTTLLHRALGVAPVSIEEPHLAVALGSLALARVTGPQHPQHPQQQSAAARPGPPPGQVPPGTGPRPVSGVPQSPPPYQGVPVRPYQPAPGRPVPPGPVPPAPGRPVPPAPPGPIGRPVPPGPQPGWPPHPGQQGPYR